MPLFSDEMLRAGIKYGQAVAVLVWVSAIHISTRSNSRIAVLTPTARDIWSGFSLCGVYFTIVFWGQEQAFKAVKPIAIEPIVQTSAFVILSLIGWMAARILVFAGYDWFRRPANRGAAFGAAFNRQFHWIGDHVRMAVYIFLCAPGAFILVRTLWHRIYWTDDTLKLYLWLLARSLDALTFGSLEAFKIKFVEDLEPRLVLAGWEKYVYSVSILFLAVGWIMKLGKGWVTGTANRRKMQTAT